MIDRRRKLTRAALVVAALTAPSARGDDPPPDVTEPPAFAEFLVIPLRVHVLQSEDLPEVHATLADADVRRIVGQVNRIWNLAGVHFGLDAIVREPAANQAKFRVARDLDPDGRPPLGLYRVLLPERKTPFDGLRVYYLHKFPVNGVYLGADYAIVQETARLREVEGGIDEPIPRVTAHELGHALGLAHRQDRTNLLASGTTGTRLNAREVETAREKARTSRGAKAVDVLLKEAESAACGDPARARRLYSWLAEIPGEGAEAARARRDALPDPTESGR